MDAGVCVKARRFQTRRGLARMSNALPTMSVWNAVLQADRVAFVPRNKNLRGLGLQWARALEIGPRGPSEPAPRETIDTKNVSIGLRHFGRENTRARVHTRMDNLLKSASNFLANCARWIMPARACPAAPNIAALRLNAEHQGEGVARAAIRSAWTAQDEPFGRALTPSVGTRQCASAASIAFLMARLIHARRLPLIGSKTHAAQIH